MPFISQQRPSIQLGLLKAIATEHGFPARTFHLNLEFARQIDPVAYEEISDFRRCFVGDWLFARAAFGDATPAREASFLDRYEEWLRELTEGFGRTLGYLAAVRDNDVPRFLDRMMDLVPWADFDVVGFTSTFQQNVASFALAARIKRAHPSVITLFGGANFEGEMGTELVRSIPCIDYAVIGEGDQAFPEFLLALERGDDVAAVAGVVCRRDGTVVDAGDRPPFSDLDSLPLPDYGEYFERAEQLGLLDSAPRRDVSIPFESARGCWWGRKHHCTFCGLNGKGMAFRAKSPKRVREELASATRRYRSFSFEAVDNILDMSYLKTLLPELIEAGTDYQIFYEVKSNLSRDHLRLLKQAGVRSVQPGIESLSTPVLKLMRKGVTAIQNVNTLRWARYYGITVGWNLLYGFPGERADDYRRQDEVLKLLAHLEPPNGLGRIWMERFSPIFMDRTRFPTRYLRPHDSYRHIYPEGVAADQMAYFFDYEFEDRIPDEELVLTRRIVDAWREAWKAPTRAALTFRSADGFVQIEDLRDHTRPGTYTFAGPLAAVYCAFSDRPTTPAAVRTRLGLPWPVEEITGAVEEFCARGLMMHDGEQFLSLALPATDGR